MGSTLIDIITSEQAEIKNQSLESVCEGKSIEFLLDECAALEMFRNDSQNLYHKVRALFFLYAIHRFYIPSYSDINCDAIIPFSAYEHILNRRFEEAIEALLAVQQNKGVNEGLSSALSDAYHKLAFQTLADQVKKSVRTTPGNSWMFRIGHPEDHPLKFQKALLTPDKKTGLYPLLSEKTPVRMDLSHSCWSDIFFLGMDYPEGAKVLNISVDLCVSGSSETPVPPIQTGLRVIDQPVIRLVSTDLEASADIRYLPEIFDFAKDYLGLLKAALIASGIVPPAMEGVDLPVSVLLDRLVGPGLGLELVSQVNNIPKGSRLAVSTNLLASLISLCMRATGQTEKLEGSLEEDERRLVAAKAILGEWIGGSGGGWQDSGGVWPGIKTIKGSKAQNGDPEFKVSKGKLLPQHTILTHDSVSMETRKKLQDSLVMVHGGMAQDVGPILEMVTEKYLLRSEKEWKARKEALELFDQIVAQLEKGDIQKLGELTQKNFDGPIQDIIPWATTAYTEKIIQKTKAAYGNKFWGFWMMGGMSGGGMGFMFAPEVKQEAQNWLLKTMLGIKKEMEYAVPFAMNPVVYDFKINENGTFAQLKTGEKALFPIKYYTLLLPSILKKEMNQLSRCQRNELEVLSHSHKMNGSYGLFVSGLFDRMIPDSSSTTQQHQNLKELLDSNGFNSVFHEEIKGALKSGKIGLAHNRLRADVKIDDSKAKNIEETELEHKEQLLATGQKALQNGELAIVTMAGGVGSRWTKGAGVVKSLHPFSKFSGIHRNFLEIHLAKNNKIAKNNSATIPHIFTTSYLTHEPISSYLKSNVKSEKVPVYLSSGQFIGLRLYPTERDLRFYWEELSQQILDEQAQKMKESLHSALIGWAKSNGEGEDYTDNLPQQCIHPVGHWFEIPNLMLNGTLKQLLEKNPNLKYLLLHNIDTLGANADPMLLGNHIHNNNALSVEVISRWLDDRGGGLAAINNKLQLVEGLSLPNEKIEFNLSYYNSGTFWISIDPLLKSFNLNRDDLQNTEKVRSNIMKIAQQMPTYITLKEVKKRWGKGQEDIYPITQFEKLWGDMTTLPGLNAEYIHVPRRRGQQLKEVSQLDGWLRDGSADYINELCDWDEL
ncbi:UTP--glucose-1-phosphate uridylyltransferase [uncultured Draconibacterium sp.]|uniref:UTP--glucose-1-phosphate uridylyltransferase n=1 Tax=uncultured Draconibacterium sp. TaxID=1573823 RepID=UPI003216F86F